MRPKRDAARVSSATRRVGVPLVALVACLFLALVDLPGMLSLGPLSMSGILTIFLPFLLITILFLDQFYMAGWSASSPLAQAYAEHTRRVPLFLWLFVLYALIRLLMAPSVEAIQNVLCYVLFIASIGMAATSLRRDYSRASKLMAAAGLVGALFFVAQVASQSPEWMGARSFAITGLITLCLLTPEATRRKAGTEREGWRGNVAGVLATLFVLAAILISLSRTALAVAVVILLFLATRASDGRRLRICLGLILSVVFLVLLIALLYPPMVERFTVGDNATVAGINMNTSGRSVLWEITWTSAWEAPLWGHGPGHSGQLVENYFGHTGIGHPHNDYLRLFNDLGIVGAILFWGGLFRLLRICIKRASHLGRRQDWSAVAGLLSVCLVAATDNIIVYNFAMMPVGVLAGMSLRDNLACFSRPTLDRNGTRATSYSASRGVR